MTRILACALLSMAAISAISCGGSPVYLLDIFVSGSEVAVAGRSIRVGNRDAPAFQVNGGVGETFIELCTPNRQKFLHGPIPITVTGVQGGSSTFNFEPLACAFSDNSGPREMDHLFLQDDGILLTDLASGDVRVWATCSDLAPGPSCPRSNDI